MAVKKEKKDETPSVEEKDSVFAEESHTEENDKEVEVDSQTEVEEELNDSMKTSAVEELLARQEERWSNKFDKLVQKIKLGSAKENLDEGAKYIADLEDDWLETPVVFFAYSINFSIHGDNTMGKETAPPNGAVHFKPVIRSKRQGRRGEEIISVSSVKVQSKSLAHYLRNHSQFGIAFFENMDAVLNMNTDWAQRLIEANSSIQKMSDQQIIARCRQEQLPIGTDIIKMRKSLVESMAEKSIKHQATMMYGALEKSVIDPKTKREIVEK